jgi:hypothetical protein
VVPAEIAAGMGSDALAPVEDLDDARAGADLDDLVQEHIVHGVVVTVHLDVVVRPARSSIRPRRRVLWGGAERDSVRGARTDPGGSPGRGAWYGF